MTYQDARKAFERGYWSDLVRACNGSAGRVARVADVNRTHLYEVLGRWGVKLERPEGPVPGVCRDTYAEARANFEREYWPALYARTGSVAKMTKAAGTFRTNYYKVAARFGIELPRRRQRGNWAMFGL